MSTPSGPAAWVVHKFGGTSVASAERYRAVAEILRREPGARKATVVSAMAGTTDALIGLVTLACQKDEAYKARLGEIQKRHEETARELLEGPRRDALHQVFQADVRDIADVLRAVFLSRSCPEQMMELVAGYGELWSAQLLSAYLGQAGLPATWLDARKVLTVRPAELGPEVDWKTSRTDLDGWRRENDAPWLVITGYVAKTHDGVPTTLKRNGSDLSGSIFAALLDAAEVTIWTDVDGVLSADPRRVPEAVVLPELSYDEAMELAYFGAKVLHPRTMAPAVARGIPIRIRNTFRPDHPGTTIHAPSGPGKPRSSTEAVRGFSTIDGISLLNVEGTGMIGVPGVSQRIFGALREAAVSVVMISQASSEHSVCLAVPEVQGERARHTIEQAFSHEIHAGQIQKVELVPACSVLAAVGEGMAHTPGVAAKLFGALSKAAINVRAIAQGSSERNISLVIDRADSTRALRAAHAGFYLSDQVLSIGVVGPGLVGKALLAQLAAQAPVLRSQAKIDLRVRGILDSRRMLLADPQVPLMSWRERLDDGVPADLSAFIDHVRSEHLPHAVLIDCSASDEIAAHYPAWLERGIHVITPNKRAGAGPLARYRAIEHHSRGLRTHFFYEATVGAGLPVITTLRDIVQTGDRVARIEGVLSGTLSYLFSTLSTEARFSDVVREARRLGYTEPDPRDDLSGVDVARKLVILAREMGLSTELSDVVVQDLVPEELRRITSVDAFLEGLSKGDEALSGQLREAAARGEVLRYVGVIEEGGQASAGLRRYPGAHPFARLTAGDNIIAFSTARYREQPLIVQGPGAGPEVTAGGVFADLLRLAHYVGAPG